MNILTRGSDITPVQTTELFPGLSEDTEISRVCGNIKRLNIEIEKRFATARDELWSDVLFPQFHLAPILHDLLSMPRASVMDGAYASSKELFRLAAILYICNLWALFGMDTVGDARYLAKLKLFWTQQDLSRIWCFTRPLFLWSVLVFCTYQGTSADMRQQWIRLLQEHAPDDWQGGQTLGVIPRGLWCQSALGSPDPILQRRESSTK